jgi:hypothetical protein
MTGATVAGVGLLSGWGQGVQALPEDARRAAAGRRVIPLETPAVESERFRRASRECVLGVAAVAAACENAGISRDDLRGDGTALVHVTAAAYGGTNRIFVDADPTRPQGEPGAGLADPPAPVAFSSALHFPYTAPSALAGEVAIEFGVTGAYAILIGGAAVTVEALWYAGRLLAQRAAERALVLAIETFAECEDLYARGRWLTARPLVEAAACALIVPGGTGLAVCTGGQASPWETVARRRAGETLSCEPLIALALAAGTNEIALTARWRGRRIALSSRGRPAATAEG